MREDFIFITIPMLITDIAIDHIMSCFLFVFLFVLRYQTYIVNMFKIDDNSKSAM